MTPAQRLARQEVIHLQWNNPDYLPTNWEQSHMKYVERLLRMGMELERKLMYKYPKDQR